MIRGKQTFARCAKPVKQETMALIDIKGIINRLQINEGLFYDELAN